MSHRFRVAIIWTVHALLIVGECQLNDNAVQPLGKAVVVFVSVYVESSDNF